jgi:hypothetical protein
MPKLWAFLGRNPPGFARAEKTVPTKLIKWANHRKPAPALAFRPVLALFDYHRNQQMTTDQAISLSTDDLAAMTLTAAAELAHKWIPNVPGAQDHIAAGAGLVLEVTLSPAIALQLMLVDSDGKRYPLARRDIKGSQHG